MKIIIKEINIPKLVDYLDDYRNEYGIMCENNRPLVYGDGNEDLYNHYGDGMSYGSGDAGNICGA